MRAAAAARIDVRGRDEIIGAVMLAEPEHVEPELIRRVRSPRGRLAMRRSGADLVARDRIRHPVAKSVDPELHLMSPPRQSIRLTWRCRGGKIMPPRRDRPFTARVPPSALLVNTGSPEARQVFDLAHFLHANRYPTSLENALARAELFRRACRSAYRARPTLRGACCCAGFAVLGCGFAP